MSAGRLWPTARFIRRVAAAHGSDAEGLRRFADQRDEAAFAELVRRHGPAVLGACRRVLGNSPDADDAFQATFLVLARKAGEISNPELLGNWLYGVAYRAALRARTLAAKRRVRERPMIDLPDEEQVPGTDWADIRPILDDEINRLPHRHRTAFVLCHVEGRTAAEASAVLGCPEGTVHSRLSWARGRLRSRLSRRGLAAAVGVLAVLLDRDALTAAVGQRQTAGAVRLAWAYTAGSASGIVPEAVTSIATYILGGTMTRLQITGVLLAGAGIVGLGGLVGTQAVGQDRANRGRFSEASGRIHRPSLTPRSKTTAFRSNRRPRWSSRRCRRPATPKSMPRRSRKFA